MAWQKSPFDSRFFLNRCVKAAKKGRVWSNVEQYKAQSALSMGQNPKHCIGTVTHRRRFRPQLSKSRFSSLYALPQPPRRFGHSLPLPSRCLEPVCLFLHTCDLNDFVLPDMKGVMDLVPSFSFIQDYFFVLCVTRTLSHCKSNPDAYLRTGFDCICLSNRLKSFAI